jgi:hypothetical protein
MFLPGAPSRAASLEKAGLGSNDTPSPKERGCQRTATACDLPAGTRPDGLSIQFEAVGVYWDGVRTALSPSEARLLACVLRRGRVSWEELDHEMGGGPRSILTVRALLHRLRTKLAKAGAADPISTVKGWGLAVRDQGCSCIACRSRERSRPKTRTARIGGAGGIQAPASLDRPSSSMRSAGR